MRFSAKRARIDELVRDAQKITDKAMESDDWLVRLAAAGQVAQIEAQIDAVRSARLDEQPGEVSSA